MKSPAQRIDELLDFLTATKPDGSQESIDRSIAAYSELKDIAHTLDCSCSNCEYGGKDGMRFILVDDATDEFSRNHVNRFCSLECLAQSVEGMYKTSIGIY